MQPPLFRLRIILQGTGERPASSNKQERMPLQRAQGRAEMGGVWDRTDCSGSSIPHRRSILWRN